MRRNASARRERFIVMGEVFVFIKQPFCSPDWLIVHCRSERGKEAVGRSTLSGVQTLVSRSFAKNLASLASSNEKSFRCDKEICFNHLTRVRGQKKTPSWR